MKLAPLLTLLALNPPAAFATFQAECSDPLYRDQGRTFLVYPTLKLGNERIAYFLAGYGVADGICKLCGYGSRSISSETSHPGFYKGLGALVNQTGRLESIAQKEEMAIIKNLTCEQ